MQGAESEKDSVVKGFPENSLRKNVLTLAISLFVVALGIGSGWLLARGGLVSQKTSGSNLLDSVVTSDKEAGAKDESQFSTTTEGVLKEGGIKGEGTHFLERPGGESQNAYLTSTSLDLNPFVDKKVTIWGETISGVHAGWLIDVGKIRVTE